MFVKLICGSGVLSKGFILCNLYWVCGLLIDCCGVFVGLCGYWIFIMVVGWLIVLESLVLVCLLFVVVLFFFFDIEFNFGKKKYENI